MSTVVGDTGILSVTLVTRTNMYPESSTITGFRDVDANVHRWAGTYRATVVFDSGGIVGMDRPRDRWPRRSLFNGGTIPLLRGRSNGTRFVRCRKKHLAICDLTSTKNSKSK